MNHLACLASTLFMSGIIAFVQVVHYPLFEFADEKRFADFHNEHSRRTCFVVIPPMIIELLTSIIMIFQPPPHAPLWLVAIGFAAAAATWLSTFLLSVPIHERLGTQGRDPRQIQRLVAVNLVRFAAWQIHALILLWITMREMGRLSE